MSIPSMLARCCARSARSQARLGALDAVRAVAGAFASVPHTPMAKPFSAKGASAASKRATKVSLTLAPELPEEENSGQDATPGEIVRFLDQHIVGQADAKRSVAIALRNRWRRRRVPDDSLRHEINPKNILMIGPTGCGKTEIARRLAKMADAPFVKVEATKYTEVGFHGRDVDDMIRDLVENSIAITKDKMRRAKQKQVAALVENKILDILTGEHFTNRPLQAPEMVTHEDADEANEGEEEQGEGEVEGGVTPSMDYSTARETFRRLLRAGELDERRIDVDVPAGAGPGGRAVQIDAGPGGHMALQELVIKVDKMFTGMKRGPGAGSEKRRMKVKHAVPLLEELETDKLLNFENVTKEAVRLAEQEGIVFIDEIDKIVTSSDMRHGTEASSEGVQQDLLPVIEGSNVQTKHGTVSTEHVLFIASGAFHSCKPSDMLAELQGRLPIRVELSGLTKEDLYRILTQPVNNMVAQQVALLETENVSLHFTEEALMEVASVAAEVNRTVDNIGARRLHTVMERVLDDVSFGASEEGTKARKEGRECHIVIDRQDVVDKVGHLMEQADLSKFIL